MEKVFLQTPRSTNNTRIRREATQVSIDLLKVEKDNNVQLQRIASSFEEFVRLKKFQLGLDVFQPFPVQDLSTPD